MWSRKTLTSMLLAAGMIGAAALPLPGFGAVDIELNFGPPAPRYEAVPAPRPGYVWAQGYWGWDGNRHVWHRGHWETARAGYVYREPHWVEHDGRWRYQASRWDHDGDGIPNRSDPTPNGEHRASRDRDHDGVPDRYDSRPDNPYRH